MTHLIVFRSCKSFVHGDNLNYGTHELIERNIAESKYPLNDVRNGYNIPFATEWHFMEYRVKKEVLPDFARDLRAINLNPYPNKTNIIGLFFSPKMRSVGRLFYFIQYIFKWLNRFPFKYLNPLKPVPVSENQTFDLYKGKWAYSYIIGYLDDPTEKFINPETNNVDYEHGDVL